MPEFLELLPPPQALRKFLDAIPATLAVEEVAVGQALGRVTAAPILAPHPLPSFPRSTVDGYAVRAGDTYGASDALPAYLGQVGEVPMGAAVDFAIGRGQCALIHTGGMLPPGADAVVMVEHTQPAGIGEVEVLRAAAVAENVLKVGEDVSAGSQVIPAGVRLRPAEIGGLLALGITRLQVACRPRVGILSSGDEVVPPDAPIGPGQVRDINAFTLSALAQQAGGWPERYGIAPDQEEALYALAYQAWQETDLVVITAGSSASTRDLTAQVVNRLGQPGVLVHGVNVKPGKPTILGVCSGKPVIGLPGNPVSALVIAGLFVVPVIERLLGLASGAVRPLVAARLTLNLASQAGREDWIPVRLEQGPAGTLADPIFSKSNLIFGLARADGLICIPADATGLPAGAPVDVHLM
jgi:molybdopterin molybdotransferase